MLHRCAQTDSIFKQPIQPTLRRPCSLLFGPGVARIPFFLLPSHEGMERREAPGSLRGSLTDLARVRLVAPTAISPLPGIAAIGVRAASDVGRCASRGSTAMPLSGTAPCSVIKRRDRRRPR